MIETIAEIEYTLVVSSRSVGHLDPPTKRERVIANQVVLVPERIILPNASVTLHPNLPRFDVQQCDGFERRYVSV